MAPPGFDDLVADELRALGLAPEPVEGGVEFDAGVRELWLANLWSRVASRILLRVGEFEAATFPSLAKGLRGLPWGDWLGREAPVSVKVAKRRTPLYHTGKLEEVALEALSEASGRFPRPGTSAPQTVYLRLDGPRVTASLDTSGEHLHRRGYRVEAGAAPIRENLAAGLLLRAGWDGAEPLLDPFCGSGTFPIEAGLMALRIAPGAARSFAFEGFASFDADAWRALKDEAAGRALRALPAPIFGADRDPRAVALAARSASRAGLSDHLQVAVADVAGLEPPAPKGLVVANPPYGIRLAGEKGALRALGAALRGPFRAWRWAAVLPAGDRAAERDAGLPVSSRRSFRSGGLRLQWTQGGGEPA